MLFFIFLIWFFLCFNAIYSVSIKPTSLFVTQNSINTYSSFCWEYSDNVMYLPILVSMNIGWGSALLVQFDVTKYQQVIKSAETLDSYLSIQTYCDSSKCTCNQDSLNLSVVLMCYDLCSSLSNQAKDPLTITNILCNTRYTSDNLQTAPATSKILTSSIFQLYQVKKLFENCDFRYLTLAITNTGKCTAWVHVNSWEFTKL